MLTVADKHQDPPVLPVTKEWRDRVQTELAKKRGAAAELARAIGISSGALTELLSEDSKYSRYVEPINEYFRWPSMMPLSPDTHELRVLLDGIDVDSIELLRALRDMPDEERRALLALVRARMKKG